MYHSQGMASCGFIVGVNLTKDTTRYQSKKLSELTRKGPDGDPGDVIRTF